MIRNGPRGRFLQSACQCQISRQSILCTVSFEDPTYRDSEGKTANRNRCEYMSAAVSRTDCVGTAGFAPNVPFVIRDRVSALGIGTNGEKCLRGRLNPRGRCGIFHAFSRGKPQPEKHVVAGCVFKVNAAESNAATDDAVSQRRAVNNADVNNLQ